MTNDKLQLAALATTEGADLCCGVKVRDTACMPKVLNSKAHNGHDNGFMYRGDRGFDREEGHTLLADTKQQAKDSKQHRHLSGMLNNSMSQPPMQNMNCRRRAGGKCP